MLGMKNHFHIRGSIEIREVEIAGVACIPNLVQQMRISVFNFVSVVKHIPSEHTSTDAMIHSVRIKTFKSLTCECIRIFNDCEVKFCKQGGHWSGKFDFSSRWGKSQEIFANRSGKF